jgi:hypothetical protein
MGTVANGGIEKHRLMASRGFELEAREVLKLGKERITGTSIDGIWSIVASYSILCVAEQWLKSHQNKVRVSSYSMC